MTKTHTGFGSRHDSLKNTQKLNLMLRDYEYAPQGVKRASLDHSRGQIVTIYENDESLRNLVVGGTCSGMVR